MPGPQGLAFFTGVERVLDCSISVGHGVSPSVAVMTIAPQVDGVAEGGRLLFLYEGQRYDFFDCKIDRASFRRNANGLIWRLSIFDRRWKWAFGEISGWYNQRHPDGAIKDETRKTLHELAELCLVAMGESVADSRIDNLPADSFPEVKWDFDVPARALASMVGDRGYRVLLQLDNRVAIRKVGEGAELPLGAIIQGSATIDPPEKPSAIGIVCEPTRYQSDMRIIAVGEDTDGRVKPLNELSYAPNKLVDNGGLTPGVMGALPEAERELAEKTVYKWYQVDDDPVASGLGLPGYKTNPGPVASRTQLVLYDRQVETRLAAGQQIGGLREGRPAIVFGTWYNDANSADFSNAQTTITPVLVGVGDKGIVSTPFELDTVNQIVKFAQPVFSNSSGDAKKLTFDTPELRLRTAASVRDEVTGALDRYARTRDLGGNFDTETRYIQTPELTRTYFSVYAGYGRNQEGPITTNVAEVDAEADQFIDGALAEYDQTSPQVNRYVGLIGTELDGAIQQVVLSIGRSGATTLIARNDEDLAQTISYTRRRKLDKERQDAELSRRSDFRRKQTFPNQGPLF